MAFYAEASSELTRGKQLLRVSMPGRQARSRRGQDEVGAADEPGGW
jgi:hypothetical protein